MTRKPVLHSADDLLAPGLEVTLAAIDPPESDRGLVALARVLAKTLDRMSPAERSAMLGQTAPQLFRCLESLEKRYQARRVPAAEVENPIAAMRAERARRRGASGA